MSSNFEELKRHIISKSISSDFYAAKSEWSLVSMKIEEDFSNCPCGQPIKEVCLIENHLNGNLTEVGNVCVNQFIEIETGNIFSGLKRIVDNIEANPNQDLIFHAFEKGYTYKNEYTFLSDIKNKRKLSLGQIAWKRKINYRIINQKKVG
jgi:hypothetical protein